MRKYISFLLYFIIFLFSIISINAQWTGSVTFCCNKYSDAFGDSCTPGTSGCTFVYENCGTSSCPLRTTIGAFTCGAGLVNGRAEMNCKYTCPDGTEAESPAACDQTPETSDPPTDICQEGSTDPACLTCDPSFASCTVINPVCTGAGCYSCASGGSDSVSGAACSTVETPGSSACFKSIDQTSNGFGCVKYEKNIWIDSQCNIAESYCRGGVSEPDGSGGIQCKDDGDPTTDDGSVQTRCVANGTGVSSPNTIACSTYSNSACGGSGWRCIPDTYCTASTITWETVCNSPVGLTGYLDGFVTGTCQFCNSVNGRSNVQCSDGLPVNPGLTGYTVTGSPTPNNAPPVGRVVKNSPVVCTQDIYSATISGTGNLCGLPQKQLDFTVTCSSGVDPRENQAWSITGTNGLSCSLSSNSGTTATFSCTKTYNTTGTDIVKYTVSDGGAYVEQSYWSNNDAVAQTFSGQVSVVYDTEPPKMYLDLTTTKSNEITATFRATDVHLREHQYYCGGVADAANLTYPYITILDNDKSLGNQFSSIIGVNNNCDESTAGDVELNETPRIVNRQFSSTIDERDVQYTFNTVLSSRDDPFSVLFNIGSKDWYAQDSFCNRSEASNPQERTIGAPWIQTDGSVYIYGDSKNIDPQEKEKAVQISIPRIDTSADTFLSKFFFLSNNPSNKLSVDRNSLSKYNLNITKTPAYLLSAYESTSTQYQTYFDEIADRIFQDANRPVNEFISNTNAIQLFEYNGDLVIGETNDITENILDNMSISSSRMYVDNKFQNYSFIPSSIDETKKTAIIINGNLDISSTSTPIRYEGANYILVRGDLTIDADIMKVDQNSALQFVVQGDLFIKGGVNHSLNLTRNDIPLYDTIQAFFLVDGRVHTYRDNPLGTQVVWDGLNIQGSIVAGQLCPNDRITLWGETGPINTNEGFYKGEGKAVPMQSGQEPCVSHLERDFIMIHNLSYPAQIISFDPTAYLLLNSGIKQYHHTRIVEDAWTGE